MCRGVLDSVFRGFSDFTLLFYVFLHQVTITKNGLCTVAASSPSH